MAMPGKLPYSFYLRDDVVTIARDLLGMYVFTRIDGLGITGGMITETEAYAGTTDRASHAWNGRRTGRTEVMYRPGGCAYVYLCYGIHSLFNIVTHREGVPHAVLIRGIMPLVGLEIMHQRTGKVPHPLKSGSGPGKVSSLLGINYRMTGTDLAGDLIWLEDRGVAPRSGEIEAGPRVGVDYAGEDALLPYRFRFHPGVNSI
jgi:DNA-3-methyladenine glycosylase